MEDLRKHPECPWESLYGKADAVVDTSGCPLDKSFAALQARASLELDQPVPNSRGFKLMAQVAVTVRPTQPRQLVTFDAHPEALSALEALLGGAGRHACDECGRGTGALPPRATSSSSIHYGPGVWTSSSNDAPSADSVRTSGSTQRSAPRVPGIASSAPAAKHLHAGTVHPTRGKVNFCKIHQRDAQRNRRLEPLFGTEVHRRLPTAPPLAGGLRAGPGVRTRILLVDDRSAAVSLPEVPLLGVLPGTGGLSRLTDKRKVRRDLADMFCTVYRRGARAPERKNGV